MTSTIPDHMPIDLTLFVACYNEAGRIAETLEIIAIAMQKLPLSYEVIVIDDASKDESVKLVQEYQNKNPHLPIKLVCNKVNQGLARNFRTAAGLGTGVYYRQICGDNVEPAENLVRFFGLLGKADIIIPYFTSVPGKAFFRILLSKLFTFLVNVLSGYAINYYNGMPVTRRECVVHWDKQNTGFGFQADFLTSLLDQGLTFVQVPAVSYERKGGKANALTMHNLFTVAGTLGRIFLKRIRRRNKGREIIYPAIETPLS